GPEVAECVWAAQWVSEDTDGFPRVAGIADERDLRRDEMLRKRKAEAKVAAKKLIKAHELPMKVVAVDHVLDQNGSGGARTTFSSPAPPRSASPSLPRARGPPLPCRSGRRKLPRATRPAYRA